MSVRRGAAVVGISSSLAASLLLVIACSSLLLVVACSSSTGDAVAVRPDASAVPSESGAETDAATDAKAEATSPTCEGACKKTALEVAFGANKRVLDRAQFGTQTSDQGAPQLHVEAHLGGAPACPFEGAPDPSYTMSSSSIPRGAPGGKASKSDGVTGVFFDIKGDLGPPLTRATAVSITSLIEDAAKPPRWTAFDITATFPEGTVKGHLYAEHCVSMDR